ncbi:hypothetical protein P5673_003544 [Acropora cervicornis]|uniref:Uncharacterized protein n=1 Tax=Acropora cervicornis TaxID=6130 RepID=A0AAD9VDX6_ACRCE|nr:hypothetical protein P5673_003544 [Acropora cervicornis]
MSSGPDENQWQKGELHHTNTATSGAGIAHLAWLRWGKRAKRWTAVTMDDNDNDVEIESEELVIGSHSAVHSHLSHPFFLCIQVVLQGEETVISKQLKVKIAPDTKNQSKPPVRACQENSFFIQCNGTRPQGNGNSFPGLFYAKLKADGKIHGIG